MKKEIVFVVCLIGLITIPSQVFAQDDLGTIIEGEEIVLEVGKKSSVHVKHIVKTGAWGEDAPRLIEILEGSHSNLTVTDDEGDRLAYTYDGNTFEESKYVILKQKLASYDVVVEYDLEEFIERDDNKWTKKIVSRHDIVVMFDDEIDLVVINSRPIDISNAKGINCIGCQMDLEYFQDGKFNPYYIDAYNKKFKIEILSDGKIQDIRFAENLKLLHFDFENKDQLIIVKIPHELLLDPFNVYLTQKNLESQMLEDIEQIRKSEFLEDGTHTSVLFRPGEIGTIAILGATQDQHDKKVQTLENKSEMAKSAPVLENERGVALPLPGTTGIQENIAENEMTENISSFEERLITKEENSQDNTIIIVIGGIIAAIIIGVIIKIKRN